jgi:hypothetical protein
MSSDDLAEFWVHRLTVQPYLGTKGSGVPIYADAVDVEGFLERKRRLVRGADGNQIISESTFYAPTTASSALLARSQVVLSARQDETGTWVTLTGEKPTTVISAGVNDSGPLDLPDHVAAVLQ